MGFSNMNHLNTIFQIYIVIPFIINQKNPSIMFFFLLGSMEVNIPHFRNFYPSWWTLEVIEELIGQKPVAFRKCTPLPSSWLSGNKSCKSSMSSSSIKEFGRETMNQFLYIIYNIFLIKVARWPVFTGQYLYCGILSCINLSIFQDNLIEIYCKLQQMILLFFIFIWQIW